MTTAKPELVSAPMWRKSTASKQADGACVEVTALGGDVIGVRDSKNPSGAMLRFTRAE